MAAVWMDQGGTFTDVVRVGQDGLWHVEKVWSATVDLEAEAQGVAQVRRGTTVATNALLERILDPVVLLTTAGLEDVAEYGDQVRLELFAVRPERAPPLAERVVGLPGRISVDGTVLAPAELETVARPLRAALDDGIDVVAIVLVHGPKCRQEVERVARFCQALGFASVVTGVDVAPAAPLLDRLHTTLADAALSARLPRAAGGWMTSEGGISAHDSAGWTGSRAVLSGPAGGAMATAALARTHCLLPAIGLDMGGTSTDLCRVDARGEVGLASGLSVGGVRLAVPAVAVEAVAAGGGSRLSVRGGTYSVGPQSAGSHPGPAAYGRGGPATLTDCEAILGRLPGFPAVCGPSGDQPLDVDAARAAVAALDPSRGVEQVAEGFRAVAHETTAGAIRQLAARAGSDPQQHTLIAFGGAGPAHACGIARAVGIRTVCVPLLAGVFSAVGVGTAPEQTVYERPVPDEGLVAGAVSSGTKLAVLCRYAGTQAALPVDVDDRLEGVLGDCCVPERSAAHAVSWRATGALLDAFAAEHERVFGLRRPGLAVEVVGVRHTVITKTPRVPPLYVAAPTAGPELVEAHVAGGWQSVRVETVGSKTPVGTTWPGPVVLRVPGATVVVEPGWEAQMVGDHLRLDDRSPPRPRVGIARDPVHTAVFGQRLMGIALEMGETLARLARSVSIRERRDFSCAVFDARGRLAVNAPHVPVHLGAMGQTVRALLESGTPLRPGMCWLTNDPRCGGSHLPDITVMQGVFDESGTLCAFVACRGHHVDVGGTHPGSMPPHATRLDEEGLVLPILVLRDLDHAIVPPPLPGCRQPDDVRADLVAQAVACAKGAHAVGRLLAELGRDAVTAQLVHLQATAADAVSEALQSFAGHHTRSVMLASALPLTVSIQVSADGRADVSLDAPRHPGNRNAPPAVARAAVLYVLRLLVGEPLPLNEGVLDRVSVHVNPGGLFDPGPDTAVAAGNVETSQQVVDALLHALGVVAGSQGTMNNLTVGTSTGAFYETIGGGAGACAAGSGASAIQVHMTNTRATDVEVLEARFPVRIERFMRRRGSGGQGRHAGGDGVVREWRFLAPAVVSVLASSRQRGGAGLAGGGDGAPGCALRDVGRGFEPAPPSWQAQAGDRLRIETPGGGGYGPARAEGLSSTD